MQIFIFLVCALCGAASGIIYDLFYVARVIVCGAELAAYTVKDKIFTAVCDILYFAALASMFLFCSYLFDFYELRLYMLVATAIGALIYLKSLHIILAICIKKAYNRINKSKSVKKDAK
ncbi:MAG: spore cortex biosynthesis protein YabQ [Candidatus Coproplasma sp.]